MGTIDYQNKAVENFLTYVDARKGKTLFAYENDFVPIVEHLQKYIDIKGRKNDFLFLPVESVSPKELHNVISNSEKFIVAMNPTFGPGISEHMKVMNELSTTLANKAYTLRDMSEVFFDVFQADPFIIKELNKKLIRALQIGKSLRITDNNGSELIVDLSCDYDWINMDCFSEVNFDLTCNLPVGEVATYSPRVSGEIYFTGALLGTIPIGRKHGLILDPIYLRIENNLVTEIKSNDKKVQEDLSFCLNFDPPYTKIVNEVALGTNYAIPQPLKGFNYKYEENQFGFHLGFGASLAQQNVQRLTPHHLDLVFANSIVYLDGKLLFDGDYNLDEFPETENDVPLRISQNLCCTTT